MTEQGGEAIRVLLVEDEAGDAMLAQLALRGFRNAHFDVVWVQSLAEAVRNIGAEVYDIVLLDLTLPDSTGIATLGQIKNAAAQLPLIVLTGQSDADFGLNALKAGAADYLVKGDFGYDGLARTIIYTLHRTKLERELDEYRLHLEELVADRTAELALAKEAAEAANRAKTVFLTNMSHELRTPLNAILGFSQLMSRDPSLDEKHRLELQTIHRSGRHLLALINDVLELARIEAGRATVQHRAFDLLDMLHSIEEIIRVRAESKGLQFVLEQQGKIPFSVSGDAQHLRQVLVNLLSNAVKYTETGCVTLKLTVLEENIRFEIIDSGPGIAPDEQTKVFQAFYQIANAAGLSEGPGLGLTISREFVRLMGGEISLESRLGEGCRFAFTLPLPVSNSMPAAIPRGVVVGLAEGQEALRILVADDARDSRELLVRLLTSVGFEVCAVENGLQAVDCFKEWRPHFIWMDIRMSGLDGYDATRQIRALPGGKDVKIVALTASVFQERLGDILAAGCDDILGKPFEEAHLFQLMGELLNVQYRYREPEAANRLNADLNLTSLAPELCLAIKQAAEKLDIDAFAGIVADLYPRDPELALQLETWVREFRFQQIQQAAETGFEASGS